MSLEEQQLSGRHEGCKRRGDVSRQIFIGSETTPAGFGIGDTLSLALFALRP